MSMQIQVHASSLHYAICILDYMIFSPLPVNVQLLIRKVQRMLNGISRL